MSSSTFASKGFTLLKTVEAAASMGSNWAAMRAQSDAPPCHYCGSIMTRNGSCYRCMNCGSTSGCS